MIVKCLAARAAPSVYNPPMSSRKGLLARMRRILELAERALEDLAGLPPATQLFDRHLAFRWDASRGPGRIVPIDEPHGFELDDLAGRPTPPGDFTVSAFVFYASDPGALALNHEVRDAFWFPLDSLSDRERHVDHPAKVESDRFYPGILVGEPGRHVVWGLTYHFLEGLLKILGQPLPNRASRS
jgi:hypothetical protein